MAQVNVLTANYGNDRTNATLQEIVLSPDRVNPGTFGKVGAFPVDGQIYAQPLYVSGWSFPGAGARNAVYVVTQHNSVYAVDADNPASKSPLWQVNLGASVPSSLLDFDDITPEVGILSTPVIDLGRGAIYVVAETLERGSCVFRLHALSLSDGHEMLNGPVRIAATLAGMGDGSIDGQLAFDALQHLQRPGLLLANGSVYAAFGSHADSSPFHGWLFAYDAGDLRNRTGVINTTPDGYGGSIWQSGRGLAEAAGKIYLGTGNGDYDGRRNFGESYLKLSPTLNVLDWFTPDNWEVLTDGDYDMGSAGPALVPGTGWLVGGNKYGTMYLIDGNSMGGLGPENSRFVQGFQAVDLGGIFTFAIWGSDNGPLVYVQEQGLPVRLYRIVEGKFDPNPVALSAEAPTDLAFAGMAISANGGQEGSGVLWLTSGDHEVDAVPGTLHAFDAGTLQELWNSDIQPDRDALGGFAKFVAPTVADGKVFVPTFTNELAIYGLLGRKAK